MTNDLIQRARAFVVSSKFDDLVPLLRDAVACGTTDGFAAVKLLARDMYDGLTFNYEFKAAAAHTLIAWGEPGLRALAENAHEEHALKNFSIAFQILAVCATGRFPNSMRTYVGDSDLVARIKAAVGDPHSLQMVARACLNRLVMSIANTDDVALYASVALNHIALTDCDAAGSLFQSMAMRYSSVGLPQLGEYDGLLQTSQDDEDAWHEFFERNPLFLDPLALQVWTKPDFHGKYQPDFLVRRADDTYLIIEIECPGKPLITLQNQLSAAATHAATQVLEYRAYLMQRFLEASTTFPGFATPDGLVLIGCEDVLTDPQQAALRRENENRAPDRIMGFDSLGKRAHRITHNHIESSVRTETARLR